MPDNGVVVNTQDGRAAYGFVVKLVKKRWYGQKLTAEEWKDVLTAALKKEKVVPGINGGFVVLGQRTSKMSKDEFSELIELTHAFMAERITA